MVGGGASTDSGYANTLTIPGMTSDLERGAYGVSIRNGSSFPQGGIVPSSTDELIAITSIVSATTFTRYTVESGAPNTVASTVLNESVSGYIHSANLVDGLYYICVGDGTGYRVFTWDGTSNSVPAEVTDSFPDYTGIVISTTECGVMGTNTITRYTLSTEWTAGTTANVVGDTSTLIAFMVNGYIFVTETDVANARVYRLSPEWTAMRSSTTTLGVYVSPEGDMYYMGSAISGVCTVYRNDASVAEVNVSQGSYYRQVLTYCDDEMICYYEFLTSGVTPITFSWNAYVIAASSKTKISTRFSEYYRPAFSVTFGSCLTPIRRGSYYAYDLSLGSGTAKAIVDKEVYLI